ncbi:DHA2 family efflux MFS transporter permease subunit [Kitasatospora paranensis]|uniref:DHA2 family efflux MFS transporter permease subunit n=1 Tax=Kitasatospora paranensis TaxID=258053 RepID=A0ABW2G687_9ACTN
MTTSAPTRTAREYRLVTLTASGGTFLAMLDSTVTNLAVPKLHHDFATASLPQLSWVITGYAVMFAALLAPAGRMADVLGRRRLFVFGIGTFTVASLLCAVAPSIAVLIGTRVLQGVGAAAMIPASLAILLLDGPADGRVKSIGLWSAASALAAAVGPTVGGILVDLLGWRSVFYINLPFGIILTVSALRLLAPTARPAGARLPDPLGTVLLALGVGALTLGVTEGSTWGWLDASTVGVLAAGVVAVALAVIRSLRHPVPAVETSLFRNGGFAATNVVSVLYGMAQYPWLLVGVLYITDLWHYSEMEAGLAMTPGAIVASITALNMGKLAPRIGGPRGVTLVGLVAILLCGLLMIFGLTDHAAFLALWLPAGFIVGIGMGATTMGTSSAAAFSAPPTKFAVGSGVNTMSRQFGGALGIAALAVILQTSGNGSRPLDSYRDVYVFCTVVVVLALLVSFVWLRLTPAAPPAAAPASAPAAQSAAAGTAPAAARQGEAAEGAR